MPVMNFALSSGVYPQLRRKISSCAQSLLIQMGSREPQLIAFAHVDHLDPDALEERLRECVTLPSNGHMLLLHRFKQCRLGARGGPVDFVG